MPGYEVDRFVGYPENEATCQLLKDLSCSICLEVLCHPVLTGGCCYEAYCESCIKSWLEANHTCPSDNKLFKEEALTAPPTLLVKLLSKLKLKCVFEERGCKVVTTIAKIEAHEKSCPLNAEPCSTCGLFSTSGGGKHDCLKALLEHKKTVSATMDRLCSEKDDAEIESLNLISQIEHCKKILKALTTERASIHSRTSTSSSGRIHDQRDLLTEARRYISSPVVEARQTRKEIVDRVLEVVKEAVTGTGNGFAEYKHAHGGRSQYHHNPGEFVIKYIKEALDWSCLGDWNAYMRYNGLGSVSHYAEEDGFVEVKLGKVTLTVFRTVESLSYSRLTSLIKAGAVHDFALYKSSSSEELKLPNRGEVEKVALACLHSTANLGEFTEKVNHDLTAQIGGIWNCCVHLSNCGVLSMRSSSSSNPVRTYTLSAGDVKILLFQTLKLQE